MSFRHTMALAFALLLNACTTQVRLNVDQYRTADLLPRDVALAYLQENSNDPKRPSYHYCVFREHRMRAVDPATVGIKYDWGAYDQFEIVGVSGGDKGPDDDGSIYVQSRSGITGLSASRCPVNFENQIMRDKHIVAMLSMGIRLADPTD